MPPKDGPIPRVHGCTGAVLVGLDPEPDLLALDLLDHDFDGTLTKKRPHRGGQRQVCRRLDFYNLAGFSGEN